MFWMIFGNLLFFSTRFPEISWKILLSCETFIVLTEKLKYKVNIICLLWQSAETMKITKYVHNLTPEDCLDVSLYFEKNKIIRFALNYRACISDSWKEVYRVDNFHGYLHEQRFWISPEPVKIEDPLPLNLVVEKYIDIIFDNFDRYRRYFEENESKNNGRTGKEAGTRNSRRED